MFKWLKRFRKPKEEPLIKVVEKTDLCSAKFLVDAKGSVKIEMEWLDDETSEMGLIVGELLFRVCAGKYENEVKHQLDKYLEENEHSLDFIAATQGYWDILKEEDKLKNEELPVISPLAVFQHGDLPNA